jgi:hypothetical protein
MPIAIDDAARIEQPVGEPGLAGAELGHLPEHEPHAAGGRAGHRPNHGEATSDVAHPPVALPQHVHEPEDGGYEQHQPHQHRELRDVPAIRVAHDVAELVTPVGGELRRHDRGDEEQHRRHDHAEARDHLSEVRVRLHLKPPSLRELLDGYCNP